MRDQFFLHRNFGILSCDSDFSSEFSKEICESDQEHSSSVSCFCFNDFEEAIEFIQYELPDFLIIDLSFPIPNLEQIRTLLNTDPWLTGIGVICVAQNNMQVDYLEIANRWNLLALLEKHNLEGIRRIFQTILKTKSIVLDSSLIKDFMKSPKGRIRINNDISEAERIANMIASWLLETSRIDRNKYYSINMCLSELLINAIEHGNCEISFSDKTKLLESGINIVEHIRSLNNTVERIRNRHVTLDYEILEDSSVWTITDMGSGFDHKAFMEKEIQNLFLPHGRGIMMARNGTDSLVYNDVGNQVTLRCLHREQERRVPAGFKEQEEITFQTGDVVFREEEESSYLYYILSGEFDVYNQDKKIGFLTPQDMFMGEMSFLLNRKRSATVIAAKPSKVLKIPQRAFIRIIKKYPNYMLLLSRLLAQRLSRTNAESTFVM